MGKNGLLTGGAGLLVGVVGTSVVWAMSRPQSFEECILKELDSSANQMVAGLITAACANEHGGGGSTSPPAPGAVVPAPTNRFDERELSLQETGQLTGRAGPTVGNLFGGTVYNGLDSVVVTEVTIEIGTVSGGDRVRRAYRDETLIQPLTSGPLQVEIITGDPGSAYEWAIAGARGRTELR